MGSILLKNVPDNVHEWLKREAAKNRRSMHQQAIACLEQVAQVGESAEYPIPLKATPKVAESAAPTKKRANNKKVAVSVDAGILAGIVGGMPDESSLSRLVEDALRALLCNSGKVAVKHHRRMSFTNVVHGGTTSLPKNSSTGAWLDFIDGLDAQ